MEPNLQTAVRGWRKSILSDGMYMNPDLITRALESNSNLDQVEEALITETRREVQDFQIYGTTGTLPVVEFLDYAIKSYEPVSENVVRDMKRTVKTMKRVAKNSLTGSNLRHVGMGIKNVIVTGGNATSTGKFDKVRASLTKIVKSCKTVGDVQYLMSDRKAGIVQLSQLKNNIKAGTAKVKYDVKVLDEHINWLKTDYYKMLLKRKEELIKQGAMESADPDHSADECKIFAIESTTLERLAEAVLTAAAECGFNPNQRNLNEITPMDGSRSFSIEPWSNAERTVGLAMCDICEAETDEEITEAMLHFARVTEAINAVYEMTEVGDLDDMEESIGSAARGVVRSTRNTTRKIARKVDKTTRGLKSGAKKTVDPIVSLIDKNVEKIKAADAAERREIILKGGIIPKIMRWLKRSIAILIGGAVGAQVPIVALMTAITFIGWICTDKYLDGKQRHAILSQLEDEIELVNEKIDDARGDSNKQKKYELMRIRNKLKRTSDKIRYNLKVNPEDDVVQNIKNKKPNVK